MIFGLVDAWQHASKPVEFHLYERGGHGFVGQHGTTADHWFEEFMWWLELREAWAPRRFGDTVRTGA